MPSPRLSAVLGVALAGSVAGNAYLLYGRRTAHAPAAGTSVPATASSGARPAAIAPRATTVTSPSTPTAVPAAFAATCPGELVAMTERLVVAERALEGRLTLEERFERAGRSPEAEARVQAYIEEVFVGAPPSLAHELECHGDTCRLTIIGAERTDFDWQDRLQSNPARRSLIRRMGFRAGTPGQDPVSKEPVVTNLVHFDLADRDAGSGLDVLAALLAEVTTAPGFADCKARHPMPGHLSLRLTLDGEARTIAIDAGGTLASEPGGTCIRDLVRQRATATEPTIAPGTLGAVQYATLSVP